MRDDHADLLELPAPGTIAPIRGPAMTVEPSPLHPADPTPPRAPSAPALRSRPGAVAPTSWTVAREAGVSQSTVSRALRGDPRVREETRRRVDEAARRLGYVPN
jgi:AraC-like DNA-binding protein